MHNVWAAKFVQVGSFSFVSHLPLYISFQQIKGRKKVGNKRERESVCVKEIERAR